MDNREKAIDIAGKLLLGWFVFESVHFLYSGRFMELARMVPDFFRNRIIVGLYVLYHMTISTIGSLALVPLMLQGRNAGIILGLAYCLSAHTVHPFDLLLSSGSLLTPINEPTVLSQMIDILWLIATIAITILFFLQRRENRDT